MRIVIDLQGAQTESRFRGIGRYSLSLAKAIVRNGGEHDIIIALSGLFPESIEFIRNEFIDLLPQEKVCIWHAQGPVKACEAGNEWRREAAELIREAFLNSLKPELIYVTSLFEGYTDNGVSSVGLFDSEIPVCTSLYDLIPLLNPEQYLTPNQSYQQYYHRKLESLKRSSGLLAISEFSKKEGLDNLTDSDASIINVSTAITSKFKVISLNEQEVQKVREKFKITSEFILYTGGADERKNLFRLIGAYSQLPSEIRNSHQLVFAGKMPEENIEQLKNKAELAGIKSNDLIFTGYISDEELVDLYNLCQLYVFPSWHEGFGLPALEAMTCGAPVIAANTTSLPEVICNPNALFDPFSETSITEKIIEVLSDDTFRLSLVKHGLEQAEKFSWDKSAKKAINAFEVISDSRKVKAVQQDNTGELIKKIGVLHTRVEPNENDISNVAKNIAFNAGVFKNKQLLLDVSEIVRSDAKSGIQRVVRSLLKELMDKPLADYQVKAIYFDGNRYLNANQFIAGFKGKSSLDVDDEITEFNQNDIYLSLDLNAGLTSIVHEQHLDLKRNGVRMYYIVYDILLLQRPDWWPIGTSEVFLAWMNSITQTATGLICISDAVADEVKEWTRLNPPERLSGPEVMSFHLGADIENSSPSKGFLHDAEFVLQQLSSKPSFLLVGTIEPRKGHLQTIEAFERLWSQGEKLNLVIVGKEGWLVDSLIQKIRHHPELGKQFFWLEGISDEYLEQVYAASTCLIAASEGEGFGLPLIEAAQYKLPIIARDIPVFREVAGEYAYYFNNDNSPIVLNKAVNEWLDLYFNQSHPKSDEMPWLTWKQSSGRLLEALFK